VVTDEITQECQTAPWGPPAQLTLGEIRRTNDVVTIEARVCDTNGAPCLDAANVVRFGLTGDGRLLDDLGTAAGSRVVQLANGRARINVELTGQTAEASVASDGLPMAFVKVETVK
jgi:beta-galactosidase